MAAVQRDFGGNAKSSFPVWRQNDRWTKNTSGAGGQAKGTEDRNTTPKDRKNIEGPGPRCRDSIPCLPRSGRGSHPCSTQQETIACLILAHPFYVVGCVGDNSIHANHMWHNKGWAPWCSNSVFIDKRGRPRPHISVRYRFPNSDIIKRVGALFRKADTMQIHSHHTADLPKPGKVGHSLDVMSVAR